MLADTLLAQRVALRGARDPRVTMQGCLPAASWTRPVPAKSSPKDGGLAGWQAHSHAAPLALQAQDGGVLLEVRDFGPGVDEAQLAHGTQRRAW